MSSLHVGKAGARRFELPLDLATQASGIVGVRGKGKTNTAVVLVEEILDQGVQVVVTDPTDVWWGLKSTRDGKKAGHAVVILGGSHGDLPLSEGSGAAVADFAVENRIPMILSLRHLRKGAAQRFVQDFAEQLYHRKGEPEHRRPLLWVMDEASRFIPQRVTGEQARLVGAIEDIVRQGRSSGFGTALIDQRPASVNKDVLTQIELLVCHAVTSPQDRKALDEWIQGKDSGGHRTEFLKDLASLERGEAWFWMPMTDLFSRVHVRERRTFDSSRTPEIGEDPVTPERFAQVDLGSLKAALEEALQDAIANDPRTLKKRIAELTRDLMDAQARAGTPQEEIDALVQAAREETEAQLDERVAQAIAQFRSQVRPRVVDMLGSARAAVAAADDLHHLFGNGNGAAPPVDLADAAPAPRSTPPAPRPRPAPPVPAPRRSASSDEIPSPWQRILDAAASLAAVGVKAPSRDNVAVFARMSPKSSQTQSHLAKLIQEGFLEVPGTGLVALTAQGKAVGSAARKPRNVRELHEAWLSYLPEAQGRILEVLLANYPDAIARDELAGLAAQSFKSSQYQSHVADLAGLGLVRYPSKGEVAINSELLFPAGLR